MILVTIMPPTRSNESESNHKSVRPKKKKKQALALKHQDYLTLLANTKKTASRNKFIDAGDNQQIGAVAECAKNLLSGNIPLSGQQLRHLQRYKTVLRKLAEKCTKRKNPTKYRQKLLKSSGGILPALLPIAISALSGLAKGIFS